MFHSSICGSILFALVSSTIMSDAVRFALEEGLVDIEDLYSDRDASEIDEEESPWMLEMQRRHELRQKRKRTEEEVLGNAQKRERRQKLIRAKKEHEMTVDALMASRKDGAFKTVMTASLTTSD